MKDWSYDGTDRKKVVFQKVIKLSINNLKEYCPLDVPYIFPSELIEYIVV